MLGRGEIAPAVSEIRLHVYLEKGRGVGWGSLLLSPVSCKGGEQVCCCVLSCRLTLSSAQGKGREGIFWHLLWAEEPRL